MFSQVDTRVPREVEAEVFARYMEMFPTGEKEFVGRAFGWATQCFEGRYEDYLAIDAKYHDFEHTLQGTLCFVRLLHGRQRAGVTPLLTRKLFELGLLAILFHDTGYLKRADDGKGTGAKYTMIHVGRSAAFADEFLRKQDYSIFETAAVQNMIRCTGVNADLGSIPFQSEMERTVGYALGTSDLLGQMAAADYVEKLPVLYLEFEEAARHEGEGSRPAAFVSVEDLMEKTPGFWSEDVRGRIEEDFAKVYQFLSDPYPDGANDYLDKIEANVARLKETLGV